MITFCIIVYIVISLYCSFRNMTTTYGMFGEKFEAQKPKEAFIEGFLTIPLLLMGAAGIVGGIVAVGTIGIGLLFCTVWLFQNMP
jgi:hypothetical protein